MAATLHCMTTCGCDTTWHNNRDDDIDAASWACGGFLTWFGVTETPERCAGALTPHSQTGVGEVGSREMALRLSFVSLGLVCS
jgi:hypothetical protein